MSLTMPPCGFALPGKDPCGKPSDRARVQSEAGTSPDAPEHVCLGCIDAVFTAHPKDLYLSYRQISTPALDVSSLDSEARRRAAGLVHALGALTSENPALAAAIAGNLARFIEDQAHRYGAIPRVSGALNDMAEILQLAAEKTGGKL